MILFIDIEPKNLENTVSDHLSPIPRGVIIADRYEIEKYLGESLLGPTYVVKTVSNKKLLALIYSKKIQKLVEHEEEVREINESCSFGCS